MSRLPHSLFDFADLFLINEEEAGRLSESRDLRGEREIVDVLESVVETRSFVSAMLESPQVVMCVPWPLSSVVVRERVQWPPILATVSWNNPYDMGVRAHDDPRVTRWNAPSFTVGDNAGDEVDPAVELES